MMTRKAFVAATVAAASVGPNEPRFAAAAVRSDLDLIWSTILDVGAQPFRTSSRATVERLFRNARASIVSPMTARDAYVTFAPVLGALNDGHVGLAFTGRLRAARKRFPLRFVLAEDDTLLVEADHTGTLAPGSRIRSIAGVPAARYASFCLEALGGQTRALQRSRITGEGVSPAIAIFGDPPSYDVLWSAGNDLPHEARIVTTTARRADASIVPYAYHTLAHGTVGYLDYRVCDEDVAAFGRFLDSMFMQMHTTPVRALIIDIRRNGGGWTEPNDLLWSSVQGKPFKQFGGTIVKSCDRIKREYGRERYVETFGLDAWRAPNAEILTSISAPREELVVPKASTVRFRKPVYLLTSTQTFSSAMNCALAAKDYGLATIVGEETGEPTSSTGQSYTLRLAATGLEAYLTTTVFVAPKPHANNRGVVPDVPVTTTIADIAAGRDPVLDRTLEMIARADGA